jgi:signal transduction histidine kinase
VSQPSVLIISDETEFAPTIMARWQTERTVPAFLLMGMPVWSESLVNACDLVLIAGVKEEDIPLFKKLEESGKPAIFLVPDTTELQRVRRQFPRMMLVRNHDGWVEALVALAVETLRRLDANARARKAEQALAQAEAHAMLGRYMLDMRHGLNNALTSVLGNSELMLLEPGAFSAEVRDQLSTIHSMALRIHDVVQRFSSMEMEMRLAAKSQSEMSVVPRTLAAVR